MTPIDRPDLRRHPRSTVDCLIQLRPATTSEVDSIRHDCIVQDVSAGGIRIWSDAAYSMGAELFLTFQCDKAGLAQAASCIVRVVWADPEPCEDRWQIGVRFGDDETSREIAAALERGCLWCERLCPEIADG